MGTGVGNHCYRRCHPWGPSGSFWSKIPSFPLIYGFQTLPRTGWDFGGTYEGPGRSWGVPASSGSFGMFRERGSRGNVGIPKWESLVEPLLAPPADPKEHFPGSANAAHEESSAQGRELGRAGKIRNSSQDGKRRGGHGPGSPGRDRTGTERLKVPRKELGSVPAEGQVTPGSLGHPEPL